MILLRESYDYIWALKNSKYRKRLSLNSAFLLKDRSSKKNSVAINSLPGW